MVGSGRRFERVARDRSRRHRRRAGRKRQPRDNAAGRQACRRAGPLLTGRKRRCRRCSRPVDGNVHVAVSPDAMTLADLQSSHGRYLYFSIDELQAGVIAISARARTRGGSGMISKIIKH